MSMKDWLEIEARFRRLAEPLQQMRLDFQWGAAGEYWRLAGVRGSPITNEFEAIATIAGRHLESVLPKQDDVFERINGESSKLHKWYRAVKELTEDFEFGPYGTQADENGNSKGNIYTGSIPRPVLTSANLCLYLHENYPIEHVSPIVFLGESTDEVVPSQSASNSLSTTNWKNWGDHPLIVFFAVIVGIATIWGVFKSEPPIVTPVTATTQNIPDNNGQQVNISNIKGGIVNITQQQDDNKKKTKDTLSNKVNTASELRKLIAQLDVEINKKKLELARNGGLSVSNFETEGRQESPKSDAYIRIEQELQALNEQRNYARKKLIDALPK